MARRRAVLSVAGATPTTKQLPLSDSRGRSGAQSLLIVGADDWGLRASVTDSIHGGFLAGAVSSVGAMVYMEDSTRAAALAVEGGEPAGLHLNLTLPFSDPRCPHPVRERHERAVRYLAGPVRRRWVPSPSLLTTFEDCILDQLEAFERLYGSEPTHVDGHHHVQQSLGVLLSRSLPPGTKIRPSFTFFPGERSLPHRLVRTAVNRAMRARFRSPRYFFSIRDIHPALGGAGLEAKLDLARHDAVEVMTHPGSDDERRVLLDPSWRALLRGRTVGSYADLT
jgi:predicted glycoside hydrolase/deacetylase ChbG (UPF0249 family)